MFKRIKNERKMQIREKRKHRLVKNPEKTQKRRKKRKNGVIMVNILLSILPHRPGNLRASK